MFDRGGEGDKFGFFVAFFFGIIYYGFFSVFFLEVLVVRKYRRLGSR